MKSKSYKVNNIVNTFNRMIDGKANKGNQEVLFGLDHVQGSDDVRVHIQGIYKLDGDENYIITGSTSKYPGYFHVVKNRKGRVNRKTKKSYIPVVTKNGKYSHPGGIQVEDDILVVGNEELNWLKVNTRDNNSVIKFYDISQSNNIVDIGLDIFRDQKNKKASGVGIVRRKKEYIVSVRAKDYLDFYTLDLNFKSTKKFRHVNRMNLRGKKKEIFNSAQSIQLFKDEKLDLYIFAMTSDQVHLFKVEIEETSKINIFKNVDYKVTKTFKPEGKSSIRWASCMNFIPVKRNANGGVDGYFELISTARKTTEIQEMKQRVLIFNRIS